LALPPPPQARDWDSVRSWRVQVRRGLLAQRLALGPALLATLGGQVRCNLTSRIDLQRYAVLGIYWPVRGEIDLRALARAHLDAGGRVVMPAVTEKGAPVEFRSWTERAPMGRDACNIPVPAERRVLEPDALLVPLVGFDAQRYRLGYGGGYYDRTLAAGGRRPFCFGVGFEQARLPSILPQPHDIPMDLIITEASPGTGAATRAEPS